MLLVNVDVQRSRQQAVADKFNATSNETVWRENDHGDAGGICGFLLSSYISTLLGGAGGNNTFVQLA
jgi:hypothetical protein